MAFEGDMKRPLIVVLTALIVFTLIANLGPTIFTNLTGLNATNVPDWLYTVMQIVAAVVILFVGVNQIRS